MIQLRNKRGHFLYYLLLMYVFILPVPKVLDFFDLGTLGIWKEYRVIGLIFAFFSLINIFSNRKRFKIDIYDFILITIFFVLGFTFFSIWFLFDKANLAVFMNASLLTWFGLLIYLFIKNMSLDERRVLGLIKAFVLAASINSGFILYEFLILNKPGRLIGMANEISMAALSSAIALIIIFAYFLYTSKAQIKIACLFLFMLNLLGLSLTQTRGPAVSFGVVAIILVAIRLFNGQKNKNYPSSIVFLFIACLFSLAVCFFDWGSLLSHLIQGHDWERITARYSEDQFAMGSGRLEIWRAAFHMGQDLYFMGAGLGQFLYRSGDYLTSLSGREYLFDRTVGHNQYIEIFIETGLIGFVLYVFFLVRVINGLFKNYRNYQSSPIYLILLGAMLLLVFSNIFRSASADPIEWLCYALATIVLRGEFFLNLRSPNVKYTKTILQSRSY